MSLRKIAATANSPLYILGSGSIGLLYASFMRLQGSHLSCCLLLRRHHRSKLVSSSSIDDNFFPLNGHSLLDDKTCSRLSMLSNNDYSINLDMKKSKQECIIAALKHINGDMSIVDIPAKIIDDSITTNGNYIQNILLSTKAPDAVSAFESIHHLLHPSERIKIIVMTNGSMAVVKELKNLIEVRGISDRVDVLYASTTHGAHRGVSNDFDTINTQTYHKSFTVSHAGFGHTYLEDTDDLCHLVSNIWNQAGLRSNLLTKKEMYVLNWKKLATNCSINPLTALRECRNGDLFKGSKSRIVSVEELRSKKEELSYHDPLIFYQLIREVSDVANEEAKSLGILDEDIEESLTYSNLLKFALGVVEDTTMNYSSMFQDIIHQRYPTEIRYLNGHVSNLGHGHFGIDTVANDYILNAIDDKTKC